MEVRCAPLSILLLAVISAGCAHAPRPSRSGFWMELGSGPSHIRVACTGCEDVSRHAGSGGYLRLGSAVSDRVLLGLESYTLVDETFGFDDGDESLVAENSTLTAITLWYPWRSAIFLKGGVGMAVGEFTLEADTENPVPAEGVGVGMTFGAGIDVLRWRGFALTASAGVWVSAIGDVVLPEQRIDDVIATMYSATLGVTIR